MPYNRSEATCIIKVVEAPGAPPPAPAPTIPTWLPIALIAGAGATATGILLYKKTRR